MKRFWRDVTIAGDQIQLDGKPVRTPGRAPLALPTPALAQAVSEEWLAVDETIDPRAMPLTGLSNAAIDRIAPGRANFAADLARYGESDLLCYRADSPAELVARQAAAWDPLLCWASNRFGIEFVVTAGIVHRAQPPGTLVALRQVLDTMDAFTLAALSPIVTVSGSLVAALALAERAADPEQVWLAARLDEEWQAEQWGEDELALAAAQTRRRDFEAGVRMLALLR